MGLEVFMARPDQRGRRRYQRLRGEDGEEVVLGDERAPARVADARWRPLRLRRRAGKAVPLLFRMSRRRSGVVGGGCKIKVIRLMRLVLLAVPARRAAALFAELVRRIASAGAAAAECPAIVFSSQWGLPVLSHSPSVGRTAQLRAFYLERSLSASSSSSSGAGSPC